MQGEKGKMPSDATVTLDLGAEEILVLLNVLRVGTLPGLGEDPTAGLSEDQLQRARAAGLNSLRARGWMKVEAGESGLKTSIDSTLVAILLTCAAAKTVLFISRLPANEAPAISYLHCGPHLFVVHSTEQPGIHRFIATISRNDALTHIVQALHLDHQSPPAMAGFTVEEETFGRVTAAIQENNGAESIRILREQGVPDDLAQQVADSISNLRANSMVALMRLDIQGGPSSSEGFGLLESTSGFWMLETRSTANGGSTVTIQPVAARVCQERIEALIPPLDSANARA